VICRELDVPLVRRYTAVGTAPVVAATISNLEAPLALAVSPDGGTLVVADGGGRQQVRAFLQNAVPLWTLGQLGGYDVNGPAVANDKFLFRDRTYWRARAYVAYSPDGRLWVGDVGNERTLIFDGNRTYQDQVMYLPHSYTVAVDPNDPKRVFNYWCEFEVDYTKPPEQGWKLVRNWSAALAQNRFSGFAEGIVGVTTLTSGSVQRTFAFVPDFTTYGPDKFVLMELPATGPLRETGRRFPETRAIYPDGSLRYYENTAASQQVWSQAFAGFDNSGNPLWALPTLLVSAPTGATDPHYRGAFSSTSGARFPSTQSGAVLFFDQQKKTPDYRGWHLGGVQTGAGKWKFRASPSGRFKKNCDADMTPFPAIHRPCWYQEGEIVAPEGSYDVADTRTEYGGNRVMAVGSHVVYGYHGEFWNSGQANQWLHFHESGLFLSQFGKPNYPTPNRDAALAGAAGNAFSPALLTVNGTIYLWHNDESAHAGVHRWKLEGAHTLQEIDVVLDTTAIGPKLRGGFNSSGVFTVSFAAAPGATYVLERSFNLQNWVPVTTNSATSFALDFVPPPGTNASVFYRARRVQ
jgi:hypothetical protein